MKKIAYAFLCITIAGAFFSCPTPVPSSSTDHNGGDVSVIPVAESTEYFTLDSESGETVFSINTASALTSDGSSYWGEIRGEDTAFSTLEVTMRKTSGSNVGGYGLIFGQRDGGTDNFSALVVLINILGEYCLGLVADNSFAYLCEWATVDNIVTGYGMENTIRIEEYDSPGRYKLFINNIETEDFEDPSETVHDGGGYGYLVVVTPVENFPSVPVTVNFEED